LNVPPLPADKEVTDYFLFELKKGYCDYYATSMVVLARAAGLPARLVIGYANGDYDRVKAEYTVRELNAHSWAEIYFPQVGWVEFEPTSNQPLIDRPLNPPAALNSNVPGNQHGETNIKHGYIAPRNRFPFPLAIMITALIGLLWIFRVQGLLTRFRTIGSIYQYIYYHGQKIHQDGPIDETPSLFAERLKGKLSLNRPILLPAADELDFLTQLYLQELFSAHPITKVERDQAIKTWRKLFWRLLYARAFAQ
jgi:hypothetical protein